MSRLPQPERETLTPEQQRVYDAIVSGPRGGVRGPFAALLYVPDLADRVQSLGEYLRFKSCFSTRLIELVILITARHFSCQYAWQAHDPQAEKAGLSKEVIAAIKEKRWPSVMQTDEEVVANFAGELLRDGKVSSESYTRVLDTFGARGAIELAVLIGYYTMIGMTLQAHEVPLKPGTEPPLST